MNTVKTQEVRIGFYWPKVVNGDHFYVCAAGFDNGAKHISSDTAEAVDCNFNCHCVLVRYWILHSRQQLAP